MSYLGRLPQRAVAAGRATGLEEVVDEHGAVGNEAIVADSDQFADEGM